MIIENKKIEGEKLTWILRCPTKFDAEELSKLRVEIDGETENLDREPGENLLSPEDFAKIILEDAESERSIFLLAEAEGKIVGFMRLVGNNLNRFRHKADFGICILKEYWGYGIGRVLLENILICADSSRIEKISLTVVETNTKAIQLYKKIWLCTRRLANKGSYS